MSFELKAYKTRSELSKLNQHADTKFVIQVLDNSCNCHFVEFIHVTLDYIKEKTEWRWYKKNIIVLKQY